MIIIISSSFVKPKQLTYPRVNVNIIFGVTKPLTHTAATPAGKVHLKQNYKKGILNGYFAFYNPE